MTSSKSQSWFYVPLSIKERRHWSKVFLRNVADKFVHANAGGGDIVPSESQIMDWTL